LAKGKFGMIKNVPKGLKRALYQASQGKNSDGTKAIVGK